jgi:hypothetical protein
MKSFDQVWQETGYQYGADALENVKLGWELCFKHLNDEYSDLFAKQLQRALDALQEA